MTSKLSFTALSISKSLEIKMSHILSFYEDMATSIAYKSNTDWFETIEIHHRNQPEQATNTTRTTIIENVVDFIKPIRRSNDIVNYLMEREQRTQINLT